MGKRNIEADNSRVRIFYAEVDGSGQTVQDLLRTVAHAINRPVRNLPLPRTAASLAPSVEFNGEIIDDAESISDGLENPQEADEPQSGRSASTRNSANRSFPRMQFVKDLDLRPTDKQHLKAMIEEKKPKDQNERIAVCLYYLRRVLELENVTANHVYTCMDDAKIRVPNDLPQTIRNIATRKGWIDCSDSTALEITTKGINLVQHDLPHN